MLTFAEQCEVLSKFKLAGIRPFTSRPPWDQFKDLSSVLNRLDADIICLQETKAVRSKLSEEFANIPEWDAYWSFNTKAIGV